MVMTNKKEAKDNAKFVREKMEKAREAMKDGVTQVVMASLVKAVQVGMTVESLWRKMKGD